MKIKKVYEDIELGDFKGLNKQYNFTKKELEDIRNRKFPNETNSKYNLYGEELDYMLPYYTHLYTGYSIEECVNYYNQNITGRLSKYSNILLVEEKTETKLLDFQAIITPSKYNL